MTSSVWMSAIDKPDLFLCRIRINCIHLKRAWLILPRYTVWMPRLGRRLVSIKEQLQVPMLMVLTVILEVSKANKKFRWLLAWGSMTLCAAWWMNSRKGQFKRIVLKTIEKNWVHSRRPIKEVESSCDQAINHWSTRLQRIRLHTSGSTPSTISTKRQMEQGYRPLSRAEAQAENR